MRNICLVIFMMLCSCADVSAQSDDVSYNGGQPIMLDTDESDDYDIILGKHNFTFVAGYVNKDWVTDMHWKTVHENFWGEEGRRLHGAQLGIGYDLLFTHGLGLHSGLYYEYYYSQSAYVRNTMQYDHFTESSLYIPFHAMFCVPVIRDMCYLKITGGFGFNLAVYGEFADDDGYYDSWGDYHQDGAHESQRYGGGIWPKRLNVSSELTVRLQIKHFEAGFTYSHGLNNHKLTEGFDTRQNKISVNVGYIFGL